MSQVTGLPLRVGFDDYPLLRPAGGIARVVRALTTAAADVEFVPYSTSTSAAARGARALGPLAFACGRYPARSVDLVWGTQHFVPLRTTPVPRVLLVHDLVAWSAPETMTPRRRRLERVVLPRSVAAADEIVVMSHAVADELRERFPSCAAPVTVLHAGGTFPAATEPASCRGDGSLRVLVLGTVEPRKRPRLVLQAVDDLRRTGAEVRVTLVGRAGWGDEPQRVRALLRPALDVWHESATDGDVLTELRAADVLVTASRYEGFDLPVLEALSQGCLVVASDIAVHREVLGGTGILVEPGSAESLSAALAQVLQLAPSERLDAGRAAIRRSRAFSWECAAQRLTASFRDQLCGARTLHASRVGAA